MTSENPDVPEELRYSPSKLKLYHFCEQRAHYHYMEGLRVEGMTTEALLRGKIIHRYLELWHRDHMHPNDACQILYKEYPTHEGFMLVTWGLTCMVRYIGRYGKDDLRRFKWHMIEERFQTTILTPKGREVVLDGILDALVEDIIEKTLGPWDNKSSSINLWDKEVVFFDPQLGQYVVMGVAHGYPISTATINQIYTGIKVVTNLANAPLDKLFSRHTIALTPRQIETWEYRLGKKIDKIIDNLDGEKDMHTGPHCKYCPFRGACQLVMRKEDPTPYIQQTMIPAIRAMQADDIAVEGLELLDDVTVS